MRVAERGRGGTVATGTDHEYTPTRTRSSCRDWCCGNASNSWALQCARHVRH